MRRSKNALIKNENNLSHLKERSGRTRTISSPDYYDLEARILPEKDVIDLVNQKLDTINLINELTRY